MVIKIKFNPDHKYKNAAYSAMIRLRETLNGSYAARRHFNQSHVKGPRVRTEAKPKVQTQPKPLKAHEGVRLQPIKPGMEPALRNKIAKENAKALARIDLTKEQGFSFTVTSGTENIQESSSFEGTGEVQELDQRNPVLVFRNKSRQGMIEIRLVHGDVHVTRVEKEEATKSGAQEKFSPYEIDDKVMYGRSQSEATNIRIEGQLRASIGKDHLFKVESDGQTTKNLKIVDVLGGRITLQREDGTTDEINRSTANVIITRVEKPEETFQPLDIRNTVQYGYRQNVGANELVEKRLRLSMGQDHLFVMERGGQTTNNLNVAAVTVGVVTFKREDGTLLDVRSSNTHTTIIRVEKPQEEQPLVRRKAPGEYEPQLLQVGHRVEYGLMQSVHDNADIEEELKRGQQEGHTFTVDEGSHSLTYLGATVENIDSDGIRFRDHNGHRFIAYRTTRNFITREAPAVSGAVEEKEEEKSPAQKQFPVDSDQGAYISVTQVQADQHRELLKVEKVGDRCSVILQQQDASDPRPANSMCEVIEIRVGDLYFAIMLRPLTGQGNQEEFNVGAMDIVTIKRIKEKPAVTQAAANEDQVLQLGTVEGKLPAGCKFPLVLKFSSGSSDTNSKSWDILQKLSTLASRSTGNDWELMGTIETQGRKIDCLSIPLIGQEVWAVPKDSPGEILKRGLFDEQLTVTITRVDAFPIGKRFFCYPEARQSHFGLFDGLVYPGRYSVRIDKRGAGPKIFEGRIKGTPVVTRERLEITFNTTDGEEITITEKDDVTIERLAPPIEVETLLKIGEDAYEFTVGNIGLQRNRDFLAWLKYEGKINRRVELQGRRSQDTLLETKLDNEGLRLMIGMSWILWAPGDKLQIKFL